MGVRYLKIVTEQEGRQEAFQAFVERAKSGLVVESDVYITTEELLAIMWKNGYSDQERNATQFTFPADYKFHYPELAVLFNLTEEDTYNYYFGMKVFGTSVVGLTTWMGFNRSAASAIKKSEYMAAQRTAADVI